MKISCPKCQQAIDPSQINVGTDVAFCTACNEAFSLAELMATGEVDEGPLGDPPKGCWVDSVFDNWEVGATMRSGAAWFLVPFTCIWSGGSLAAIFGSQIAKGKFDLSASLFGMPFLVFSIPLVAVALMSVCGKTVLSVREDQAQVFVGVGSLGWRRRFLWSQITHVTETESAAKSNGQAMRILRLEGGEKIIQFGFGLSDERRIFLLRYLRQKIVKPRH